MHQVARWCKCLIVTVLAALVVVSTTVNAAEDFPLLPSPISFEDLDRFGAILKLNDAQQSAAEESLDIYFDAFEQMRTESIELAVKYPRKGREEFEQLTKLVSPCVAKVRALDAEFFAKIEPLLTEVQRESLPRLMQWRERRVLSGIDATARFIGDGLPELRDLIYDLHLPVETLEIIEPELSNYEQRLTQYIRNIHDASIRLCAVAPEGAADSLITNVREARALNRRTFENLKRHLPQPQARHFRVAFYLRAYGGAVYSTTDYLVQMLDELLESSDLTDAHREVIINMKGEMDEFIFAQQDTIAEMLDREAIAVAGPRGAWTNDEYLKTVNAAGSAIRNKAFENQKVLMKLIGKERLDQASQSPPKREVYFPKPSTRMACGLVVNISVVKKAVAASAPQDPYIEPHVMRPIDVDSMRDMARALSASPDEQLILMKLHEDYLGRVTAFSKPLKDQFTRLRFAGPQPEADPFARANQMRDLLGQIREEIVRADAELIANVQAVLDPHGENAVLRTIQHWRDRSRVRLTFIAHSMDNPNRAAEVDLIRLLLKQTLPDEAWDQVLETVSAYETQMLQALTSQFQAYEQHEYMTIARRDGYRTEKLNEHLDWGKEQEDLHVLHREVAKINQAMIVRLLTELPESHATALRNAYRRAAYPGAFFAESPTHSALAGSLELPDLSPLQRTRIQEIHNDFRIGNERVNDQFANACAAVPADVPMLGLSWNMERRAAWERYELTAAQLNDQRIRMDRRAAREIRKVLTPAQLSQVTSVAGDP